MTLRVCKTPVSVITDDSAEDLCFPCRALGFCKLVHTEASQKQFHIIYYERGWTGGERQNVIGEMLVEVVYNSYKLHGENIALLHQQKAIFKQDNEDVVINHVVLFTQLLIISQNMPQCPTLPAVMAGITFWGQLWLCKRFSRLPKWQTSHSTYCWSWCNHCWTYTLLKCPK